jgi:phosphate transport system protein
MDNPHIVKAFDRDLAALTANIKTMGEFANVQFCDAVHALLHRDIAQAERVIEQDRQVDGLRRDVSLAAAIVIARRQPVAADLNEVLADLRIAEDLERIGDLAKNTAKRAVAISNRVFPEDLTVRLKEFADAAAEQLRLGLSAYVHHNAPQALAVRSNDEELDRLHTQLFRELVSRTSGDEEQVIGFVHLLFCAKNIERIGDHAAHIAEAAYLLATGHPPETERRRMDESSAIVESVAHGSPPTKAPPK